MATKQKQTKTQTKTLTKTKGKAKGKAVAAPKLPNGYKVIGRAPNWDFETDAVVQGIRGEIREVVMDEGTKKERTVRNFIVQDDSLGAVTVWESGGLRDLFDQTEEGDDVIIEYLGVAKSAKKGQNPMKLFSCGKREEE